MAVRSSAFEPNFSSSCLSRDSTPYCPPKLQRRGACILSKVVTMERVWWVTMERVWWVTMIVHEGLLWISNGIWYGMVWYMGHTSMSRFREGIVTFFGGGWLL